MTSHHNYRSQTLFLCYTLTARETRQKSFPSKDGLPLWLARPHKKLPIRTCFSWIQMDQSNYITVNLRILNKPIILRQPFQQNKSCSGDCFLAQCGKIYSGQRKRHKMPVYKFPAVEWAISCLFRLQISGSNIEIFLYHKNTESRPWWTLHWDVLIDFCFFLGWVSLTSPRKASLQG